MSGAFSELYVKVLSYPGGWSRIDHPNRTGHHDDAANVTAGSLWRATAATGAEGMTVENMRRIKAESRMRGPYRRLLGPDQRAAFAERFLGERRAAQLRRGIWPGQKPEP